MDSEIRPPAAPTQVRHGFVDALRGFSLLGIMVVNIEFIVQPAETGWFFYQGQVDTVVRWLVVALGQTKIYPLFALLFGYGLALQLKRAQQGGVDLGSRYRRRMVVLGAMGVVHGVVFFPGDILVLYAIIGAFAYRFRHTDTRRLLVVALGTYGAAALVWLLVGAGSVLAPSGPPSVAADAVEVLSSGSLVEVVILHFFYWLVTLAILAAIQGPAVFSCFLAGIALGRTTWLADPAQHQPLARRVLRWSAWGWLGAALGATLTVVGGSWKTLGFAVGFAAAPMVAASYLAGLGLLLVHRSTAISRLSQVLQASGRMSLTVYLLESVVATTLAYGYGFGLFARTGPLAGVMIALMIWLGLSAFSVIWMGRFQFGPVEWGLRSLTYRRRQPLWRAL